MQAIVISGKQRRRSSEEIALALDEIGYRAYWSIGPYFNPQNSFKNPKNIWPPTTPLSANLICGHLETPMWFPAETVFLGATDNWRKAVERMSQVAEAAE